MLKRILITTSLQLLLAAGVAAQAKYPVSEIPDSLSKGAIAVVRDNSREITLNGDRGFVVKEYSAITIFSEKDKEFGYYVQFYDPSYRITDFKGTVYDQNGKRIKKISESDLVDQSLTSSSNLFDENRVKFYKYDSPTYPFTIVYETEKTSKVLMNLPSWHAYPNSDMGIQKNSIKYVYPDNLTLKYKVYGVDAKPEESVENGKKVLTFQMSNLKPISNEVYLPSIWRIAPFVDFSIGQMRYDSFSGSTDTWEQMSSFFYQLFKDRDDVSDALKSKFEKLKGKPEEEVLEAVRKYLDENTRYVSIQLGIGGYQPFKASVVERTGFGDCKALANMAYTLLRCAGVKSYHTFIQMDGQDAVDPSFAKDYFNHMILAVPRQKDTLWMDCTAPRYNTGYLPSSDRGCHVLLLSESGEKLAKTPSVSYTNNKKGRSILFEIDREGNASGKITTQAQCEFGEKYLHRQYESVDDQKKIITEALPFSNPEVSNVTYKNSGNSELQIQECFSVKASKYCSVVGKRMFVPVIPIERNRMLPKIEKRKFDIDLDLGYTSTDTLEFKLPEGYKVEVLPSEVALNSEFGTYTLKCKVDNGVLKVFRQTQVKEGLYKASKYPELYDFFKKMSLNDGSKVILIKEGA